MTAPESGFPDPAFPPPQPSPGDGPQPGRGQPPLYGYQPPYAGYPPPQPQQTPYGGYPPPQPPPCYRHPDRPAGSVCRRCNRPICPECMREAPVGWQCSDCVKQGARISPTVRWRPGGAGRLGNTRITPAVGVIIAACVVVYLAQSASPNTYYVSHNIAGYCPKINCRFELIPALVHHGQFYRLITSAFLHASPEHLILNMISLAIVGPAVEAEIGKGRFVVGYLVCALGGSAVSYVLEPVQEASLGASGAIFGVMGAYYILARRNGWDTSVILGLLIINLIYSFASPGIAWQDHLGGLATGLVLTAALAYGPSALQRRSDMLSAAVVYEVLVALVVTVVLSALVILPPGHINV